jgi:NAD(P)-dependent dehydrogenase (short-subunit alcohol dehydrogenase family)
MKLQGKSAIITGASLGLGRVIAEAFVREGAQVLICARNAESLEQAAGELRKLAATGQKIVPRACDVSVPAQVEELINCAIREFGACDILVNNAAIHGPKGPLEDNAWEEWRQALEVNLFGTVWPCRAVIPQMKKQGRGKIINLSGGGATGPRPFFTAYATAKAAVVRFTETLAEELREHHIEVNAIAPGAMKTRLIADGLAAGPDKIGAKAYAELERINDTGGDSPEEAAHLAVFLASAESDDITGKLISARWDPWREFPDHKEELITSDLYTLRRIVPKDRGKTWGEPT